MKPAFTKYFMLILFLWSSASAQIVGVKTIPGDFTSIKKAVDSLNLLGTAAPGVTFNIASGYVENISGLQNNQIILNTNTGSANSPIVFQKAPGAQQHPRINLSGASASNLTDGCFIIAGSDYVTIDAIDVYSFDYTVDWGFALVKKNSSAPFDGCQHITIRNCTINLTKMSSGSAYGIYTGNHIYSNTSALAITSTSDANSYNKFYGNTIINANTGISLNGYNAASNYSLYDQGNEIGVDAPNSISGFGTGSYPCGISAYYQNGFNISNNLIASGNLQDGVGGISGIYLGTAYQAGGLIDNNSITINCNTQNTPLYGIYSAVGQNGSTDTLTIRNNTLSNVNYTATSGGTCYGIYNSIVSGTGPNILNIYGNSLHDLTLSGSGSFTVIEAGLSNLQNVYNNTLYNITKYNATLYGMVIRGTTVNVHDNILHDLNIPSAGGTLYGIYNNYYSTNENYFSNQIYNLANTGTGGITGMYLNTTTGIRACYSNLIHTLNGGGAVSGMSHFSSTPSIYRNNIYDLTSTTGSGQTIGIDIESGNTIYVYNNFISDLKASNSTNTNAVVGIFKAASGTGLYCYYNSIYLNATSTSQSTFGTSGIYLDTYNSSELKNNLVVNLSTPVSLSGPAYCVGLRRTGTSLNTFSTSSNNNLYYCGIPGSYNPIYFDGTNTDISLVQYKVRMSPRESASITELPPFVDVVNHDLHINASIPTLVENNGLRISTPIAITSDIDGNPRWGETGYTGAGTSTDIGADEGNFTVMPPMSYTSSTSNQQIGYVFSGNTNQVVIQVKITVNGNSTPYALTQFTLNSNGTSDITDINTSTAKVYYTGNSPVFSSAILFGSTTPSLSNFMVNGNTVLSSGDNYFWLSYDVKQTALTGHLIDGECVSFVLGGISHIPSVTAPAGNRSILGPMSGTYLVGAGETFPNFSTLTEAALNINNRGVNGPVILSLTNDVSIPYSSNNGESIPITFNEIPLVSATNTVTLKPANGKSPFITSSSSSSTFLLNGTDYFILDGSSSNNPGRNLTIENTNTGSWTAAGCISNGVNGLGANHVTIKNCIFHATNVNSNSTYGLSVGSTVGASGSYNNYLTLANNEFSRAFSGVYINGTSGATTDSLLMYNNTIGSSNPLNYIRYTGLVLGSCSGNVSNNEVVGIIDTTGAGYFNAYGIYAGGGVKNSIFQGNNFHLIGSAIHNCGTGIITDLASTGVNVTIANNLFYDISGLGTANIGSYGTCGIKIRGISTNVKVYYNSIYLSGYLNNPTSTNDISAGIYVDASTTLLDIRNNIIYNSIENITGVSKAYAIYSSASSAAYSYLDYNDYYVSGYEAMLAYWGGADRSTLAALKAASGKDQHSLQVNPDYNGTSHLICYPTSSVLNVCPSLSITNDYLLQSRPAPTSMGAYENGADVTGPIISYTPLKNTIQDGYRQLIASIKDYHGKVASSGNAKPVLYWKINHGAFNTAQGTALTDTTFSFLFGSGVYIGDTVSYYIVAQDTISNPNVSVYPSSGASGLSASPPSVAVPPSSLSSYRILMGINGTYNIPNQIVTLTGAGGLFSILNDRVLTGNLNIVVLANANIMEPGTFELNEISAEDTSFHLTIMPLDTNSISTFTGNYNGALIRFNGADGVRINGFKKLVFKNTFSGGGTTLKLYNESDNNIINGCYFYSYQNSVNATDISLIGATHNNVISNNYIYTSYAGIYLDGTYWDIASGNKIYNNQISNSGAEITKYGIYAMYQDNLLIKGNVFSNIISGFGPIGIYAEGTTNSTFERNDLHDLIYNASSYDGASGITFRSLSANPNITIKNNIIRHLGGIGSSPNVNDGNSIPAGIKLFGTATGGINLYNNSIYLNKDSINGLFYSNEWNTCVEIGAGISGINMINNILQNSMGKRTPSITGWGYAVYCKSSTSPFSTIDYNVYYASNFDYNYLGLSGTTSPPTNNMSLSAWRTFTSQDAHSFWSDPQYASTSNLKPLQASIASANGLPMPGVVDFDFSGSARGPVTSIGAYENITAISKNVTLTVFLESLYAGNYQMREVMDENGSHFGAGIADKINIDLYNANAPYTLVTSFPNLNLNTSGMVNFQVSGYYSGNYYIKITNRNHLETWSALPVPFTTPIVQYDFSTSAQQAFGIDAQVHLNNEVYALYTGDINQSGYVDVDDFAIFEPDLTSGPVGFLITDLNGSGYTDIDDFALFEPRLTQGVASQTPAK